MADLDRWDRASLELQGERVRLICGMPWGGLEAAYYRFIAGLIDALDGWAR